MKRTTRKKKDKETGETFCTVPATMSLETYLLWNPVFTPPLAGCFNTEKLTSLGFDLFYESKVLN